MTTKLDKVLYTAKAHTTGGREGRSVSDDGILDVTLQPPKEMGGKGGATNPEQAAEGTIRKQFALSIGENSVHGSDSQDNAKIEIAQFFTDADIVG